MNKCRLRKLEVLPKGSKSYRVRRDLGIRYRSHLEGCIDHLDMAEAHLDCELSGENVNGLITNISNARYEIKKYFSGVGVSNGDGDND